MPPVIGAWETGRSRKFAVSPPPGPGRLRLSVGSNPLRQLVPIANHKGPVPHAGAKNGSTPAGHC